MLLWVGAGCQSNGASDFRLTPEQGDGYRTAVAELQFDLDATARLADDHDWTRHERLAWGHLAMARLTGSFEPYDGAVAHLQQAFSIAPQGSGPHEAQASVALSLHRLADASEAVVDARDARLFLDDLTEARLEMLDGHLLWQAGEYVQGAERFAAARDVRVTYDVHTSLAHHAWHTGDFATADAEHERALDVLGLERGQLVAWIHLQRGLMDLDRDRVADAYDHYLDADRAFPGWWLVHEHVAEVLVLLERPHEAHELYVDVIARTGAPEFRDALAELIGPFTPEGRAQVRLARASYDAQLAAYPEAAAGHALDHVLAFGEPEEAVALAIANVDARPNAYAYLKLAQAHHVAGDLPAALEAIETARSTPWRTPELHDVAAQLFAEAGDAPRARQERQLAEDLRASP